jgi:hypothetical protein
MVVLDKVNINAQHRKSTAIPCFKEETAIVTDASLVQDPHPLQRSLLNAHTTLQNSQNDRSRFPLQLGVSVLRSATRAY